MFKWIKNIVGSSSTKEENTVVAVAAAPQEELLMPETINTFLTENGPEQTMDWLIQELLTGLYNSEAAEVFGDYYAAKYSKKDILDKYEDLVQVKRETLTGIILLGEHYKQELVERYFAAKDDFCIYDAAFVQNFAQDLSTGELTIKAAEDKLWKQYFNFVKNFLKIAKKVGIEENYEPADEIEAMLIKLLKDERYQL